MIRRMNEKWTRKEWKLKNGTVGFDIEKMDTRNEHRRNWALKEWNFEEKVRNEWKFKERTREEWKLIELTREELTIMIRHGKSESMMNGHSYGMKTEVMFIFKEWKGKELCFLHKEKIHLLEGSFENYEWTMSTHDKKTCNDQRFIRNRQGRNLVI